MLRSITCARRRLTPSRTPPASSTSALRSAGTNRPSSVSTAMPMSTCGCRVRTSLSPSNQALSAGTAFAPVQLARIRRTVTSLPGAQAVASPATPPRVWLVGGARRWHGQAVVGVECDADVDVLVQGAYQLVAVEPGVERGYRFRPGAVRADQAHGDVVARRPGVDVGVVAERGGHDLGVCVGHDPGHVAAHALDLLGLAAGGHRRRDRKSTRLNSSH